MNLTTEEWKLILDGMEHSVGYTHLPFSEEGEVDALRAKIEGHLNQGTELR